MKLIVAVNSWDFTLYKCDDLYYVMKVIFSEGDFKVDVERYFIVTEFISFNAGNIEELKHLSSKIREGYYLFRENEIRKKDFNLI